jgi:hypothetical protein
LPASACAALALLIALQIALPSRTELPSDPGLAARRPRQPVAEPIPAYPLLAAGAVFSPDRAPGAGLAQAAAIDRCEAVGSLAMAGHVALLVKAPGEPAQLVRPGGAACGWRLARIAGDQALFVRGAERHTLTLGQAPQATVAADAAAPAPQGPAQ